MSLQVDCTKRQAPKSVANTAALPVHGMPAPLPRGTRQESNLSHQTHPRFHLHLQSATPSPTLDPSYVAASTWMFPIALSTPGYHRPYRLPADPQRAHSHPRLQTRCTQRNARPRALTIYALALARRISLPLKFFKCGWFNERDYFDFFPLPGCLQTKKPRMKNGGRNGKSLRSGSYHSPSRRVVREYVHETY